jgi:hypothetical protein
MPFGTCDGCGRFYVIAHEGSLQRSCRHCHRPLRVTTRAEALGPLKQALSHPDPPHDPFEAQLSAAAQKAEFLEHWAQEVITETTTFREQVAAQLLAARALRRELAQTISDLRAAVAAPPLGSLRPPKEGARPIEPPTPGCGQVPDRKRLPGPESETITVAVTSALGLANDCDALLTALRDVEEVAAAGADYANKPLQRARLECDYFVGR